MSSRPALSTAPWRTLLGLTLAGLVLAPWAEANQATRRTESGRVSRARADSLNELIALAGAKHAAGSYTRAEELWRRALEVHGRALGENDPAVAALRDGLARTLTRRGAFAEADDLARQALASRERRFGDAHPLVAESLATLADLACERDDLDAAVTLAERALSTAAKTYAADSLPYQWFATKLARVEARRGNFARAQELIEASLRVREAAADRESAAFADSIAASAMLHLLKRDNVAAAELAARTLRLEETLLGPDHPRLVEIVGTLGLLAYRQRDLSGAKEQYVRALSILEKSVGLDHPAAVRISNNLGLVYWKEGDRARAREQYERALALVERFFGPDSPRLAPATANLGIIAKEAGDYAAAESYYTRSVALLETLYGPNHPDIVAPLESLGILYRDRGDHALAEPYFLRVRAISEAALGPEHPEVARHFDNLYHLYARWGDAPRSLEALERRLAIEEHNLPLQLAVGSERQKLATFVPFFGGGIDDAVWFDMRHGGSPRARELAVTTVLRRKGRVLDLMAGSLATLRERASAEDRARLDALGDVTATLAGLVLNGPRHIPLEEHQRQIAALTAERDALEQDLSRRMAGRIERADTVTLDAIRTALPPDTVLLEIAVYRPFNPTAPLESDALYGAPRYAAYAIAREGAVRAVDLGAAAEIDALVNAFRRAVRNPKRNDVRAAARALDARVMQPLRPFLGSATRLLISPDGQLHLIPFEALLDERERYLVERFEIGYLNSGRDLLRMNAPRPHRTAALIVADPLFGDPESRGTAGEDLRPATALRGITTGEDLANVYFAPLAGTAHEAKAIKALFPDAEVLTRATATEGAVRSAAAPRILHIATHGFLLGDPVGGETDGEGTTRAIQADLAIENPLLRSGLALAGANLSGDAADDGILTALEASSLDLWGTKLVTLSACDTGVGEVKNGDGVYGLRRAFFMAGAETLVMSLWPVSDSVTRRMMASYYAGLKEGLGRGAALRRAQLAMLARGGQRHPFYWASFIQLGNWDPLGGLQLPPEQLRRETPAGAQYTAP